MKGIRNDETYQRFKRILKNASQTDLAKTYEEIKSLHAGRLIRGMTRKVSAKKLISAVTQDQAYRSRLVEINMTVTHEYASLKVCYDATKDKLSAKYSKQLGVRSIADRDTYWRSVLSKGVTRLENLSNTIELLNMVIEDIDKAAWSAKTTLQAFDLATRPEVQI